LHILQAWMAAILNWRTELFAASKIRGSLAFDLRRGRD
jgi:hypothetical protein